MTRSSTRGAAVLAAAALTIGGSVVAAPAHAAAADEVAVLDASFVWGISGYAQKGIFGAWVLDDFAGDAVLLPGSSQTEYVVAPVPVTSFPTAPAPSVAPNGNAVKFTGGTGVVDHVDGRLEISWGGEFTLNGYPASFNAPDETFADPQLVVEDGDAVLTFDVTIGGGVDDNGDPTEPVSAGRIPVVVVSDVAVNDVLDGSVRLTPDYQGVELPEELGSQATCEATGGSTGWWGSWPIEFVSAISESVRPHYYSTGCGGLQDNKPPLPIDLVFDTEAEAPVITTQPASVSVEVGSTATFAAEVTGADSLQWQSRSGAGKWADVEGATVATLEVAATSVSQSGTQYRVVAVNDGGSVESAAATLTVTQATPGVKVAVKKNFRFASKTKATVTVDAPEGVAATGAVTIKAGKKVVGKGEVKGGKAVVTLTKKLLPGKANLTAEFAGNADLTAAKSPVTKVTVKKAAAKITAKLAKKKVKVGKRATLRVKVTSANVKPGGKVKITITKGKKVRTLTVKVKAGKTVKVTLPKLAKGKYKVKAQYQGTKDVAKKSAKTVTLRVR